MDLIASEPFSLVPCGWAGCDEMNKAKKKYFVLLGLIILTGLRMFPDLPNAWSWNNRSEGIQEPVAILAGINNDTSLSSSRVFHPPSVFVDDQLGYCFVSTNIPSGILESAGIDLNPLTENGKPKPLPSFSELWEMLSRDNGDDYIRSSGNVYVVCTVPSLWTKGQDVPIRFYLYNDGYSTAYVTLEFTGYDYDSAIGYFDETSVEGYTTVRHYSDKVEYLYLDTSGTYIGVKGGAASAGGDASYDHDFGYNFVQKFNIPPTLPPNDDMSYTSGNPNYYWEGLSDIDGYSVDDDYALFHSDDWEIRWLAADLIDSYLLKKQNAISEKMTLEIWDLMTYKKDNSIEYSVQCAWSDYRIINMGYWGVCDEHANLAASLLRSLGIPVRRLNGGIPNGHAWMEVWVKSSGVWQWIHADPTLGQYDNPGYYSNVTWCKINSRWDDSIHSPPKTCVGDGDDTNGLLASKGYNDRTYEVDYPGPINYP